MHGTRRNLYQIDRRPTLLNDHNSEDKPSSLNDDNFKSRRIQQNHSARLKEPTNRPTSEFRSKYNKYLPKINTYKTTLMNSNSNDKVVQNIKTNDDKTNQEYTDVMYDDDDYDYVPISQNSKSDRNPTKPITFNREKGYRLKTINRQN